MTANTELQFNFDLYGEVGVDAQYQVKNTYPDELEREELYSNDEFGFKFRGLVKDIYHGHTIVHRSSASHKVPASLIVFHFQLAQDPYKTKNRRVKFLQINLSFDYLNDSSQASDRYPFIIKTDPSEKMLCGSTPATDVSERGVDIGNSNIGRINGKWTTTVEQTTHAKLVALLSRSRNVHGKRNYGPLNVVQWMADENQAAKSGVPQDIRVAVLVGHSGQERFTIKADITARVDTLYQLQKWIGKQEVDDPVICDPRISVALASMSQEDRTRLEDLGAYMDANSVAKFC